MAETLYLTPAGTPPLSPVQAPRKRKYPPTREESASISAPLKNAAKQAKESLPNRVPPSRVPKTKQTKSRNGCHTCKAKRLKCDETKPTCQNCARRNVECEGYKKEFKWKGFPEQNIGRKLIREPISKPAQAALSPSIDAHLECASASILSQTEEQPRGPILEVPYCDPGECAGLDLALRSCSDIQSSPPQCHETVSADLSARELYPLPHFCEPILTECVDEIPSRPGSIPLESTGPTPFEDITVSLEACTDLTPPTSADTFSSSFFSDYLWPRLYNNGQIKVNEGTDQALITSIPPQIDSELGSPELLVRHFFTSTCSILSIFPSSTVDNSPQYNPWQTLIWPLVRVGDFPMLYHGLLSMACFHGSQNEPHLRRDGAEHMRTSLELLQKNQSWVNLPVEVALATCIALAFSESWMCWKRTIKSGAGYIKNAKQCIIHALANGAQTRDQKRQLRFLLDCDVSNDTFDNIAVQVLGVPQSKPPNSISGEFCLTNTPDNGSYGFECHTDLITQSMASGPTPSRLDPLMGSASTLFPVIGRVANLVRRVYNSHSSTPSTISAAVDLKQQLESWSSPVAQSSNHLQEEANHTAEAYRLSTLLHLHQSVPELIPANQDSSIFFAALGLRVLNYLARIPPNSGTLIIHIYPLLVGGCEAKSEDDRTWVAQRWNVMEKRMGIGNVGKAREIVAEVWKRRDEADALDAESTTAGGAIRCASWDELILSGNTADLDVDPQRSYSWSAVSDEFSFDSVFNVSGASYEGIPSNGSTESLGNCFDGTDNNAFMKTPDRSTNELDSTIRGRLHWVGVMKEWGWEVLLG